MNDDNILEQPADVASVDLGPERPEQLSVTISYCLYCGHQGRMPAGTPRGHRVECAGCGELASTVDPHIMRIAALTERRKVVDYLWMLQGSPQITHSDQALGRPSPGWLRVLADAIRRGEHRS